jgi:hypothetical protein
MKENRERDIESLLRSMAPAPAPPDLRDQVLAAAAMQGSKSASSTPFVRACFATCAAILVVIGVADWALGRAENVRLAALVGPTLQTESRSYDWAALDDVFDGLPLVTKKLITRPDMRFRPGPRSWDILKEDFDGGQNTENHN